MYIVSLLIFLFSNPLPDYIKLNHEDQVLNIRSIDFCNERFYIVDQYNKSINSFTREGEYLRTYSSYGQGPGDFNPQTGPMNIRCLKSGDLVVTDTRNRLIFFDADFNHIETKVVQQETNISQFLLQSLILETESSLYFEVMLEPSDAAERNSVVVINKETSVISDVIGAPVFTKHRFLNRHNTIYDKYSEYFVSYSRITGLVRPFQKGAEEYFSFIVQDEMSFEFFEQNLPEFPRSLSDFETTGITEGHVINSLISFNGNIYLIQDRFSSEPGKHIDVYDYQGNHIDKIPNIHQIVGLVVLGGAIYGYNPDDLELFLIKKL